MSVLRVVGFRFLRLLAILFLVYTFSFLLLHALPGDAITQRFSDPDLALTPEQIEQIRQAYGTDRSLPEQYVTGVLNLLTGDLGVSVSQTASVGTLIAAGLPQTLQLAGLSALVGVLIAAAIVATASLAPVPVLRQAAQSLPALLAATPSFWLAIVLIQVLSFELGLVPTIRPDPVEALILPVLTLGLFFAGPLAQVLTESIASARHAGYVETARVQGASEGRLLRGEILRNIALPAVTVGALAFGNLIGGTVVTETIFGLNGLGRLTNDAVAGRDFPLLQMILLVSAAGYGLVNFLADSLYQVLDPRLRGWAR